MNSLESWNFRTHSLITLNSYGQTSRNNRYAVDWIGFLCHRGLASYSDISDRKRDLDVFQIINRSFSPLLHHHGDRLPFVLKTCGWNISYSKQLFLSAGSKTLLMGDRDINS